MNAHGYERQTADLDLLVRTADRESWHALMTSLGYQVFHEQGAFLQLSPPADSAWPVDLMFVNDTTFSTMLAEASKIHLTGAEVKIPSLDHLLALKLHALKHTHFRRELKDLLDVITLIEIHQIDIKGEKFRKLCERYGSSQVYEKIAAASR